MLPLKFFSLDDNYLDWIMTTHTDDSYQEVPYGLNFGGRKLWWIATNKHFGRQNIGGLAALQHKIARIKILGGQNFGRLVSNRQIHQGFLLLKFFCAIWVVITQRYCTYHPILSFGVWLHWSRIRYTYT